jgi:hypothetical protein
MCRVRYHQLSDPLKSTARHGAYLLLVVNSSDHPAVPVCAVRLAVVLLAVSGLGSPPVAPDLFDDIHARVRIAEAKRQTIRARFTETTI